MDKKALIEKLLSSENFFRFCQRGITLTELKEIIEEDPTPLLLEMVSMKDKTAPKEIASYLKISKKIAYKRFSKYCDETGSFSPFFVFKTDYRKYKDFLIWRENKQTHALTIPIKEITAVTGLSRRYIYRIAKVKNGKVEALSLLFYIEKRLKEYEFRIKQIKMLKDKILNQNYEQNTQLKYDRSCEQV